MIMLIWIFMLIYWHTYTKSSILFENFTVDQRYMLEFPSRAIK